MAASAWIRGYHRAAAGAPRLVCFPHAGGSASYFFPVSRALTPRIEVLAVQYPGRQDRRLEPCIDDVRTMADVVVGELAPWLDGPLALFGHSLGATVAYEVALRLAARDTVPLALFSSGRRAPSTHREEWVHLADDARLLADMHRLNGTGGVVLGDDEFMRAILPAVRNDYRAAETYRHRPEPPLPCPIVALTGDDDPQVTLEEAQAWAGHTRAWFALRVYPGGHFFVNDHVAAILAEITDVMAGAHTP